MIHRTARERLLFEARDVPRDVLRLEGIRGHHATLEPSGHGPSRMVRVWHGGDLVSWHFGLAAGELRPHFHPEDLPFMGGMACEATWDDEVGLVVTWTAPPPVGQRDALRALMESAVEQLQERRAHPMVPGTTFDDDRLGNALRSLSLPESGDVMGHHMERIAAFHEAEGWRREGGDWAVAERLAFTRGAAERTVVARAIGAVIITLHEPGSEANPQTWGRPDLAREGLRLKWRPDATDGGGGGAGGTSPGS